MKKFSTVMLLFQSLLEEKQMVNEFLQFLEITLSMLPTFVCAP